MRGLDTWLAASRGLPPKPDMQESTSSSALSVPPQRNTPNLRPWYHSSFEASERHSLILQVRNEIVPPFNLILHIAGIVRWTHQFLGRDLVGLKRYIDQRQTYCGVQTRAA